MKWKNLGIVAAIFIALGAYVYYYEIKGEKTREEISEKAKKLFQFEEKEIASITLKNADGELVLQKEKDFWKVSKPIEAKADKYSADSLASDVASAKTDRTLDEPNINWKNFGLDPPAIKVSVKLNDGKTQEIELGDKDFNAGSVFARVPGQNKVLLLSSTLHSSASKKLFDFRDKSVVEFQRDQIKGLSVTVKGKEYSLEKSGDDWQVKKPFESRGDNSEINSVVSDLELAKAEEFVDTPDKNLRTYGLATPEVRVDLFLGENRARKTLLIGSKVDSNYYAKDESRDTVLKIKEDLRKKLDIDPQKIRDKKVVRFERSNLKQIEVKLADKTFLFSKGSDDKWKVNKPEAQQGKSLVEYKIFWPLEDLDGKELIDNANLKDAKYGFATPSAQIKITDKSDKSTEVILGKVENDRIYAMAGGGTTVYKVDKKILDDLNFKVDEIIEK
jgi:hypothetical protein